MKTKITIEYTEMVTPQRCRKARPQEGKTEITVNIREVSAEHAPVAFIVAEYHCELRKVRLYKGKLYRQVQDRREDWRVARKNPKRIPMRINQTADKVDWQCTLKHGCLRHKTLAENTKSAKKQAANHIVVDGEAYERTGEPYYCVTCFGLGHNHGGTSFTVGWADSHNRQTLWGLSPIDKQAAIDRAVVIALSQGDTLSESYIRDGGSGNIEVLMLEAVKCRYNR